MAGKTTVICEKCKRFFNTSQIKRHENVCDGSFKTIIKTEFTGFCKFCGKTCKNHNSQRNHERLCKSNPNRDITESGFSQYNLDIKNGKKKRPENQYTKANRLGLPKPEISKEERQRRSDNNKKRSPEFRKKVAEVASKTILDKAAKGDWHVSLAKNMHHNYNGIDLHGKWELAFAMYLDREGILWERNKFRFPYTFKDKTRTYTPDFYIVGTNTFIEIKGYERDIDQIKWAQFPEDKNLIVIKEQTLKSMLLKYDDLHSMIN